MNTKIETFSPDYIISPGEILEETLEARGIKKKEFAERCGRTAKMISEIIAGKAAISPETALQFERVLGVSAALWTNLETKYRLRLAEKEEYERLEQHVGILENFASFFGELEKRGFVGRTQSPAQKLANLIEFFGVGGVEALHSRFDTAVSFRKSLSFESDHYALNTWLRCGEIKAFDIDTAPYNAEKFKRNLYTIRKFTTKSIEDAIPQVVHLCAEAGVAFVVIPEIKGSCINGAARWVSKDKALIQLSARYLVDDIFWFTFFHEAGHILLHGKKDVYIDEGEDSNDKQEQEANTFSQNMLISKEEWWDFTKMTNWNVDAIKKFADKIEIAPGIIVGRLQHHEKEVAPSSKKHNNLKARFKWDESKKYLVSKQHI